ncbi:MAG: LuxR C-terminal-related transcriptional regulator, partial [Nocardioides sp.]
RPVLSVVYAGTLLATGTVEGVEQRLRDAEFWLAGAHEPEPAEMVVVDEEELRRLPGWVAIYRSAQALLLGDPTATVNHAQRALHLLDAEDQIANAAASALVGLASWGQGDLGAAHEAYASCSTLFRRAGYLSDVLACALTLGDIRVTQGRLREAMSTYQEALRLTNHDDNKDGRRPVLRGTADMHVAMSEVHREHDDLDAADRCLQSSHELGEHIGLPQNRYRWRVAMAHLRAAQGNVDAALALIDEAQRAYVGDFAPEVRPVSAFRARLLVGQGRLDEAFAWADERNLSFDDELSYLREFEHLTLARMLTARSATQGSRQDGADADGLLVRLLDAAENGGRTGSVLDVLVLQSLVLQLHGDIAAALVPLDRALRLAAPEGYARLFLDHGPPMMALLRTAADQGRSPRYVSRLLGTGTVEQRDPPPSTAGVGPLIEPLSAREQHVLRLLATDLAGPDIARELVVSLSTVRTHTRSIYAKLGVNNRRAAVRRAGELDLLSESARRR